MQKTHNIRFVFTFFCFSFILSSCDVTVPELGDIEQVRLTSVEGNVFHVEAVLPVSNDNWHRISVYDVDLQVYVDGKKLGKVKDVKRIVIKRKTTTEQVIGFELTMPGLLSGGLSFLRMMSQDQISLTIRGEITAGAFLVMRKNISVNEKFSVRLK